ncbi:MAG TPA: hypothetical protein VFF24_07770 [Acidimicrobiia bacterium]|jgi:rRNA processing protein Gar1|nr:hypothetical protein [Acidimicrobiia bacterium]
MATKTNLKTGDRVRVPWGLGELVGVVVDVYGPPAAPFALVDVPVHGASGEVLERTRVSYPASALEPVEGSDVPD